MQQHNAAGSEVMPGRKVGSFSRRDSMRLPMPGRLIDRYQSAVSNLSRAGGIRYRILRGSMARNASGAFPQKIWPDCRYKISKISKSGVYFIGS
jgi:hypothetical protein